MPHLDRDNASLLHFPARTWKTSAVKRVMRVPWEVWVRAVVGSSLHSLARSCRFRRRAKSGCSQRGYTGAVGSFPKRPSARRFSPGTTEGRATDNARSSRNRLTPLPLAHQVARKWPHLKVHQVVGAFARKHHAAIGRDRAELVKQAANVRIVNRFGRADFRIVPSFEGLQVDPSEYTACGIFKNSGHLARMFAVMVGNQ